MTFSEYFNVKPPPKYYSVSFLLLFYRLMSLTIDIIPHCVYLLSTDINIHFLPFCYFLPCKSEK